MGKVITLFKLLPKKHQILLSILSVITMITMLLPSEEAQASRQTTSIDDQAQINTRYDVPLAFRSPERPELPEGQTDNAPTTAEPLSSPDALAAGGVNNQAAGSHESALHRDVEHFNVKNGDTLAAVFDRAGLTSKDVYEITQLPLAKQNLLKIMPGEEIVISKDANGNLTEVRYRVDAISTLVITKSQEQYNEKSPKRMWKSATISPVPKLRAISGMPPSMQACLPTRYYNYRPYSAGISTLP